MVHLLLFILQFIIYFFIGNLILRLIKIRSELTLAKILLCGFSFVAVFLRYPVRLNFDPIYFEGILLALFLFSVLYFIKFKNFHEMKTTSSDFLVLGIITLISLTAYLPIIVTNNGFFQNLGPDIDGHLLSAAFVEAGKNHQDALNILKEMTGSISWWDPSLVTWQHPDFRDAVGVEFLVRSNRFTHAVISTFLSKITSFNLWTCLLSLMSFSYFLGLLVVRDFLRFKNFTKFNKILFIVIVGLSQSSLMLIHEGIIGQLIAMPITLFLFFSIPRIFTEQNKSDLFFYVLVLSALLTTFVEGIDVFVFTCLVFYLFIIFKMVRTGQRVKSFLLKYLYLIIFFFIFNLPMSFDFILITKMRLLQKFFGGALNFKWSIFGLLFNFPVSKVTGTGVVINLLAAEHYIQIIEVILLMIFLHLIYWHKFKKFDLSLTAILLTLATVTITGHLYAIWKYIIIIQPILLLFFFDSIKNLKLKKGVMLLLVLISVGGYLSLFADYTKYTYPSPVHWLDNKFDNVKNKKFAILSASLSRTYFKLGVKFPLVWLNFRRYTEWDANYLIGDIKDYKIFAIFNCEAEGEISCKKYKSKNGIIDEFFDTNNTVGDILGPDGHVDEKKFLDLKSEAFQM